MKEIYDRQKGFLAITLPKEAARGYHFRRDHFPVNIDDGFDQSRLKLASWCVVEEIQEFKQALHEDDTDAAQEEVVDICCFAANLGLMCDIEAGPLPGGRGSDFDTAVYYLGLAMNELKNRPHRSSFTPTDRGKFRNNMVLFLGYIFAGAEYYLGGKQALLDAYNRKADINVERQNNGY